jgi:arabinofuranosyltransferase
MGGRFFAAPFFLSVLVIVYVFSNLKVKDLTCFILTIILILIGLSLPYNPVLSNSEYVGYGFERGGIADERGFYYQHAGLLTQHAKEHEWAQDGMAIREQSDFVTEEKFVVIRASIGLRGYYGGPKVHIVGIFALSDPLLSRLPSKNEWRIGHFPRDIPEGYIESLQSGNNVIKDPDLSTYYAKILLITRGEIFSFERMKTIIEMNFGKYKHLVEFKN